MRSQVSLRGVGLVPKPSRLPSSMSREPKPFSKSKAVSNHPSQGHSRPHARRRHSSHPTHVG